MKMRAKSVILVLAVAVAATTGTVGAAAAHEAEVPEVDIVVSSSDTVGDVVGRVADQHGADVTARVMDQLADAVADGASSTMPGLDALGPDDAADGLRATADALSSDEELPADVASLPVAPEQGFSSDSDVDGTLSSFSGSYRAMTVAVEEEGPDIIDGEQGSTDPRPEDVPAGSDQVPDGSTTAGPRATSYTQLNWIRRSVSGPRGPVVKDRIELRWTTNPGAVSSAISYNYSYPLNNGFFRSVNMDTYSYTGTSKTWGDRVGATSMFPGGFSRTIYNNPKANGKSLSHLTVLSARTSSGTWVDRESTPAAQCNKSNNSCYYAGSKTGSGI